MFLPTAAALPSPSPQGEGNARYPQGEGGGMDRPEARSIASRLMQMVWGRSPSTLVLAQALNLGMKICVRALKHVLTDGGHLVVHIQTSVHSML